MRRRLLPPLLAAMGMGLVLHQGARGADCLRYEPELVRLEGTLRLAVLPGPPHYRSFEAGDQPESVWLLTLASPVCIDAIPGDVWNIDQANVQTVQIIPRASFSLSLNGKPAQVEGTLYRARGGHPHAEIALRATRVAAALK